MAEYIAFDPNAETAGYLILGINEALRRIDVDVTPYLVKHGLDKVQPEDWVKQQKQLDLLKDISENSGNYFSLIAVGKLVPEISAKPPVNTIHELFALTKEYYHMNHRGGDIGEYIPEFLGERHIRLTARNPYPSDLDYGIIWGTAKMFAPEGSFVKVVRAESPCRLKGDDRCIYDITW